MTATYDLIQTYTANGSQSTINFSSIPNTYTDLILISSGSSGGYIEIRVGNGTVDTGSGSSYSRTYMYGDTSSVPTFRNVSLDRWYNTFGTTGVVGVSILNFMNYSNANTQKSGIFRGDSTLNYVSATAVLWQYTNPIDIIQIVGGGGTNFSNGTTHTLYGIKAE